MRDMDMDDDDDIDAAETTEEYITYNVKQFQERLSINHIRVRVSPMYMTDLLLYFDEEGTDFTCNYVIGIDKDEIVEAIPPDKGAGIASKNSYVITNDALEVNSGTALSIVLTHVAEDGGELTENQIDSLITLLTKMCVNYTIPLNRIFEDNKTPIAWFDLLNVLGSRIVGLSFQEE